MARMNSVRLVAMVASVAVLLAACAGDPSGSGADGGSGDPIADGTTAVAAVGDLANAGLEVGTSWVLASFVLDDQEVALVDDAPITLRRTEQGIEGSSACNTYGADRQQLDGDGDLLFPPVHVTEMACLDEQVMQLEATYLAALAEVDGAASEDGALVLSSDRATLRFDSTG